jgi:hypothetical protein
MKKVDLLEEPRRVGFETREIMSWFSIRLWAPPHSVE